MYKILFIDDDPLILRRLHQILDWDSLEFEILPDATDGKIALSQIINTPPDIVICDINMPNMDGLTLAEKTKSLYPNIQYIILTVNDSFGCAQQALNMGVDYYLLKPIDSEKLLEMIKKITYELESSHQEKAYLNDLKDKAMLSERMIREKFLNWLVTGRQPLSEEQLREKFDFYQIPLHAQEYQILSLHINSFKDHMINLNTMDKLMETVINTVEDSLCTYQNWIAFSDAFYNLNIILGFSGENDLQIPGNDFIGQILRDALLFRLNLPVTVFYSRRYQGARNLYCCYYETKFLCQYTAAVIDKGVLSFDDYIHSELDSAFDFDALRSNTLKQLRGSNFEKLKEHVSSTLHRALKIGSLESFNMLRIDFVMTGIMFLQENKIALQDVFQKHFSPLAEIIEHNDPEKCISFLDDYFFHILDYVNKNKISSQHRISEKCTEIILENLSNPNMTIKWLASQLYINENYLSRLFKDETGVTPNKYIMKQRMLTAKQYLDQNYSNLQQIALEVGFSDPFYFSKCFKKEFGIAPSKYLKMSSQ